MKKKPNYTPLAIIYEKMLFKTLYDEQLFNDFQKSNVSLSPFTFDKSVIGSYLINNHFCTTEEFIEKFELNEEDVINKGEYVHLIDIMLFQRNREVENKSNVPKELADFIGRDFAICMGWFNNNDFSIDTNTTKNLVENANAYCNLKPVDQSDDDNTIITKFEC